MDPQSQFCRNEHCTARGLRGQGTIRIHSRKEGRYRCTTWGGTFSAMTRTAFWGLRTLATVQMTSKGLAVPMHQHLLGGRA